MSPVYARFSRAIPQTATTPAEGLANALMDAEGPSGRGHQAGTPCPLWTAPTSPEALA